MTMHSQNHIKFGFIDIDLLHSHSHSVEKIQESSNSDTNNRYFTWIHVRYLAQVFLECELFQTKAVGKIKTHFMFNNYLSKIVPLMTKCIKMLYSRKGHRWQYDVARALWIFV